jgi:hypothetical protein
VLEARGEHRRQQPERLAVRAREQVGDQRQLGDVEFQVAHHALEREHRLRFDEVEG